MSVANNGPGSITSRIAAVGVGVAQGETARETAVRLHMSPFTVQKYRRVWVESLGARNLPNAVQVAHDRGILR